MKLAFTKMQGAGNDFVVLDCTQQKFDLSKQQLQRLADRHLGVGCDQILVVERPRDAAALGETGGLRGRVDAVPAEVVGENARKLGLRSHR